MSSGGLLGDLLQASGGPLGGQKLSQRSPTLGSSDSVQIENPTSKIVQKPCVLQLGGLNGINSLGKLKPDVTVYQPALLFIACAPPHPQRRTKVSPVTRSAPIVNKKSLQHMFRHISTCQTVMSTNVKHAEVCTVQWQHDELGRTVVDTFRTSHFKRDNGGALTI